MISEDMRAHIGATLAATAAGEGVRILYAAESGSRAWGFPSPDSDYDVRFLYRHPRDWYVSLWEAGDVIERPLDARSVDLAGWDVRKALRLLMRSNPALHEWLVSPIVYIDGPLRAELKALFEAAAAPRALAHHYWSIAHSQWRRELLGQEQVRLKKYFYVVRPLLSLAWVAERGTPPPMSISALLAAVPPPATPLAAFEALLREKSETRELGSRLPVAAIDTWAAAELERLHPDRLTLPDAPARSRRAEADRLYRRIVGIET